ncbi:hypothetical protein SVAN01_02807 [Stagonosporopsis vannaccii]|nr:hypothetical protein SVAN01_02807 [Stagonosporopsis vannaccii]
MLHVSRNVDITSPRKWKGWRGSCMAFWRWTMGSRSGGWW